MQWLIDETNHTKIKLTGNQYVKAKSLIDRGIVTDILDDKILAMEVTDGDGDLIVDEHMYEKLRIILAMNPHTI